MDFNPEEYERQQMGLPESNPNPNPTNETKSEIDKVMEWLGENLNKIPDWVVIAGILIFFLIAIVTSMTSEK